MSSAAPTTSENPHAELDASVRTPVVAFYAGALFWLVVGTVMALVASLKLHWPEFLGGAGFSFGRLWPAHRAVLGYGWASMAGLGTAIWMTVRLTKTPLRMSTPLVLAALVWNVAVLTGMFGVLAGYGTSVEWLDFPPETVALFGAAFVLLAIWQIDALRHRRESDLYVSQWYIMAALFVFPLIYLASNWLIFASPITGLPLAAVQWWYQHNVLGLWFLPLGLAPILYLLPKVTGRPLSSYTLAVLAFWLFVLFFNWVGPMHLIQANLPTWLTTLSTIGGAMILVSVATFFFNYQFTVAKSLLELRYSPTLRFLTFGTVCFLFSMVLGLLLSLKIFDEIVQFTQFRTGFHDLTLYGFFSSVMFGAIYYIMPRVNAWPWASPLAMRLHFWTFAAGTLTATIGLILAGMAQGQAMSEPTESFLGIIADLQPFFLIRAGALGAIVIGSVVFGLHFLNNLFRVGEPNTEPALMAPYRQARAPLPAAVVYRNVFLTLPLVLIAEYLIAVFLRKLPFLPLALILVSLAFVYVALVGWYLMYLRNEGRWVFAMLIPTSVLAVVLIVALYPDMVLHPSVESLPGQSEVAASPSTAMTNSAVSP